MVRPTTRVLAVLELLQGHGRMAGPELARRVGELRADPDPVVADAADWALRRLRGEEGQAGFEADIRA